MQRLNRKLKSSLICHRAKAVFNSVHVYLLFFFQKMCIWSLDITWSISSAMKASQSAWACRLLSLTLYFSFYPAESEELLSKEPEEVSEAVRKRSRKAWGSKMWLFSKDLWITFRVPFVCGRISQEAWHHLDHETGKCTITFLKWDKDEWMPSFCGRRGKHAGNPQEELHVAG